MDEETATQTEAPLVGRARLAEDLRALGVAPGGLLMVHARISALGWVIGGSGAVVRALLDALGPDGTPMAYAGWEDDPFELAQWPAGRRAAYEADLPPFDPRTAEAVHANGRLPERIRTWPGAVRGRHPEAGMVAIGAQAAWLTADHPWDDAYGAGSPLAKLVAADGQVLMLGAPLSTVTLLHHAEATAWVAEMRRVAYRMPMLEDGRTIWREFRDIDTANGAFPYEQAADEVAATLVADAGPDPFAAIATQAIAAGTGHRGAIGAVASVLFPAGELHGFAEEWMEKRFGGCADRSAMPKADLFCRRAHGRRRASGRTAAGQAFGVAGPVMRRTNPRCGRTARADRPACSHGRDASRRRLQQAVVARALWGRMEGSSPSTPPNRMTGRR